MWVKRQSRRRLNCCQGRLRQHGSSNDVWQEGLKARSYMKGAHRVSKAWTPTLESNGRDLETQVPVRSSSPEIPIRERQLGRSFNSDHSVRRAGEGPGAAKNAIGFRYVDDRGTSQPYAVASVTNQWVIIHRVAAHFGSSPSCSELQFQLARLWPSTLSTLIVVEIPAEQG